MFDVAPAPPTAWVFPGQGAQRVEMLDPFRTAPGYRLVLDQIASLLGFDPATAALEPGLMERNLVSSLLTVAASVLALDLVRATGAAEPAGGAGYSVGQWTALYAAGALDRETLFTLVAERARLMDAALAGRGPCGMLAVIGLARDVLAAVCTETAVRGHCLEIANENAPGQFTLSGDEPGLRFAETALAPMRPRRLRRLAVAGAWHGRLMRPAVAPLERLIETLGLRPPAWPVIDNTTGDWLPRDLPPDVLAAQVAAPVLWTQGVQTLVASGTRTFVEIGYGDTLSQFGFFIDRGRQHTALVPMPRRRA